ncbi:MAG: tRNA (guanine(10)-N(2))-dimethyltransferase [Thermoprotei archaeon]|nr:MAG: tRNA (guanine(10)-N(2))-dimethyltransferase [Thermoprotei archaeon]
MADEEFVIRREGLARVLVPNPELYRRSDGSYEPAWAPVFYNPAMVSNRDSTILILNAVGTRFRVVADSLAGTGVRGIRIALEVPAVDKVFINDIDPRAHQLIKMNVELNPDAKLRVVATRMDANELHGMLRRIGMRPDYVDVDPYGSPAPFTFTALYTVRIGGIVGFTATDLAPLGGKYPLKSLRRYHSYVMKTDFGKELAIRNLLGFIARTAGIIDRAVEPLLAYQHRHYIRIFVRVYSGAKRSLEMFSRKIGYIEYCPRCGFRRVVQGITTPSGGGRCPICGARTVLLGPLWVSNLADRDVVDKSLSLAEKLEWLSSREELKIILESIKREDAIEVPYFRVSKVASYLKVNMPKVTQVIECLRDMGFSAVRSYMEPDAVRSDADYRSINKCIEELGKRGS